MIVFLIELFILALIAVEDFRKKLISLWSLLLLAPIVLFLSFPDFTDKFWIPDFVPFAILMLGSALAFFRKGLIPVGSADVVLVALLCIRWPVTASLMILMAASAGGLLYFLITRMKNREIPFGAVLSLIWISSEAWWFISSGGFSGLNGLSPV